LKQLLLEGEKMVTIPMGFTIFFFLVAVIFYFISLILDKKIKRLLRKKQTYILGVPEDMKEFNTITMLGVYKYLLLTSASIMVILLLANLAFQT
jgi:hypothetical protein